VASKVVTAMRKKVIVVENFILVVVDVVLLFAGKLEYERCLKCLRSDCEPNM
jgi:hypothetical protein